MSATNAKNHFGELLEATQKEPAEISEKGRTVAVMLSAEAFEQMHAKAEGKSESPDIDGILGWLERDPAEGPSKETGDYRKHLDEKFA
ncbi:MAG: type II toxin-antitoxin system prevent-host-death family antitoxin [Symploca sp. SIO2E6]|nr:type II toxin-antitoxin system prevent-host-death family antitoxin [Symploca sp. SIO2E6]